jgi:uncharacterized membrane protein
MPRYEIRDRRGAQLALGLGWFSIGLGLAELAAPRALAKVIGARDDQPTTTLLRAYGARELANGIAILAQPDRAAWLWTRVGGDAIDLSSLAVELNAEDGHRGRLTAATAAVLGVTALDVLCARRLSGQGSRQWSDVRTRRQAGRHVEVARVTTINRPVEEVYAFWRNFENLPRFMKHLESVRAVDGRRSHWRAKGPAGMSVEWDAEITGERENEAIAWRSLEGSDVEHKGSVEFRHAPGARGTEVRVTLEYVPPAGALGRTVAWLFGEEPDRQIKEDLQRFKQLMETGEIPVSDGPGLWRAAQPAAPQPEPILSGVSQ